MTLHIHFLCMMPRDAEALNTALKTTPLPSSITHTLHQSDLKKLPLDVKFDTIVSPANSFGRLDGGFDDAISRAFSPAGDYLALTKHVQSHLYTEWKGFAPPGTCTLIPIPETFAETSKFGKRFQTKHLALCPTMRIPQSAEWDREIVYECVWSLLCAIDKHNSSLSTSAQQDKIQNILMTPLATGIGRVSPQRWANQLLLAIKHFDDAKENEDKWKALEVPHILDCSQEVIDTWTL